MPIANAYSTNQGFDFENAPPGDYEAICYQIIDVGTQATTFKGQTTYKNQIVLTFELHGADAGGNKILTKDGKPFSITYKHYGKLPNLSMNSKANFRSMLSTWRGKPIADDEVDTPEKTVGLIKSFLGKACSTIVMEENYVDNQGQPKTVYKMSPPQRLHPRVPVPERVNDLFFFDIGNWEQDKFEKMRGWKKLIEQSKEYQERQAFGGFNVTAPGQSFAKQAPKRFDPHVPLNPNTGLPIKQDAIPDGFDSQIPF